MNLEHKIAESIYYDTYYGGRREYAPPFDENDVLGRAAMTTAKSIWALVTSSLANTEEEKQ